MLSGVPSTTSHGSLPYSTQPTKDQLAACAEFPDLLKAIVGNGDMRSISRLSRSLGSEIVLEPKFHNNDDPIGSIIDGFYIVPKTDKMFFRDHVFKAWYLIGNTTEDGLSAPKAVSIMTFAFSWPINCVKVSDIVKRFGQPDDSILISPGTSNFQISLGKGPYYATRLSATVLYGRDYITTIEILQTNTAP